MANAAATLAAIGAATGNKKAMRQLSQALGGKSSAARAGDTPDMAELRRRLGPAVNRAASGKGGGPRAV